MTIPTRTSGRYVLVSMETATPGTYERICGFKDRSFKASRPSVDTTVQDCDDPDVVVVSRDVGAISYEITGDGVVTMTGLPKMAAWFESGDPKNIKVEVGAGVGWTTYTGAALLTDYEVSGGADGGDAAMKASIASTGAWVRSTNT